MLREPSVSWLPYFSSSPGAWTTFTRDQSASISSATIMGRLVRTPVPISARCATIVTVPSGAIDTNTRGSLTVPCGILAAPVEYAASARRGSTCTASTRAPPIPSVRRRPRRDTFSIVRGGRAANPAAGSVAASGAGSAPGAAAGRTNRSNAFMAQAPVAARATAASMRW